MRIKRIVGEFCWNLVSDQFENHSNRQVTIANRPRLVKGKAQLSIGMCGARAMVMSAHHASDKLEALLVLSLKTEADMVFSGSNFPTVNGSSFGFKNFSLIIGRD